jgi:hypothetical protein
LTSKPLVKSDLLYIDDLNINTAAKIAFAGFFYNSEYINDKITRIKRSQGFRKLNIYFGENNNYIILTLKHNKTSTKSISIKIILIAIRFLIYPIKILLELFANNIRPFSVLLFRLYNKPFSYNIVIPII